MRWPSHILSKFLYLEEKSIMSKSKKKDEYAITLLQGINHFLNGMKILRGSPVSTIEAYCKDLDIFREFMTLRFPGVRKLEQIGHVHIVAFKRYLVEEYTYKVSGQDKRYSPSSIERKMNCLKAFFKSMSESQYIEKNIATSIPSRTKEKSQRRKEFKNSIQNVLTKDEIQRLIDAAIDKGDRFATRNSALITFLANTGCRRSDALNIIWEDVNFIEETIILFRDKSNVGDIIPMKSDLKAALEKLWYSNCPEPMDPVFTSRQQNKSLSPSRFNAIFNDCVKISSLKKGFKVTPHALRHSVLTRMAQNGATVQQLLAVSGHKDPRSLESYLHYNMDFKKKAFSKF